MFGGFFVESINRGLLRNGVLLVPGVDIPGPMNLVRGAGVPCKAISRGIALGVGWGAGESSEIEGRGRDSGDSGGSAPCCANF